MTEFFEIPIHERWLLCMHDDTKKVSHKASSLGLILTISSLTFFILNSYLGGTGLEKLLIFALGFFGVTPALLLLSFFLFFSEIAKNKTVRLGQLIISAVLGFSVLCMVGFIFHLLSNG